MEKTSQVILSIFTNREYSDIKISEDMITAIKQDGEKIYVRLTVIDKLNTKYMKEVINNMKEVGINHTIIIYNSITPPVKKALSDIENLPDKLIIEMYTFYELQIDIIKHRLCCKHEVVNKSEIGKIPLSKLPVILKSDPMLKYLCTKKGDVIKIYRKDGSIMYRYVK